MQTGRKRDKPIPDVPTIYELMDQYKSSPAVGIERVTARLHAGRQAR
jgi:hypothetical protein